MRQSDRLWTYQLDSVAWVLVVTNNTPKPATVAIMLGTPAPAANNTLALRGDEWALLRKAFEMPSVGNAPNFLVHRDEWLVGTILNAPFGVPMIGFRCPLGVSMLLTQREWEYAVAAAEGQIASLVPTVGIGETEE